MNAGQAVLDRAREAWRKQPTMGTAIPPSEPPAEFVSMFSVQEQINDLRRRVEELEGERR